MKLNYIQIFQTYVLQVNFDESGIVVTEPYFNFPSIREAVTEILFEDYQFQYSFICTRKLFIIAHRVLGLH